MRISAVTTAAALPSGGWDRQPREVVLRPINWQGATGAGGFFVAALNPFRPLDERYDGFLDLVAGQITAGLANATAYEQERQRAEALAELDRAKTTFFSNISHEFRTPLTLMLGPLEELLAQPRTTGSNSDHRQIDLAYRNGLRLLKLVNTLLDFSRIEAGRMQAAFRPTDLAAFTGELASSFQSAMESATRPR
jgi:signal transduction histidine kinase